MEARVELVLARDPRQPEGNLDERLELLVHLTPQGQIDHDAAERGGGGRVLAGAGAIARLSGRLLVRSEIGWALQGAPDSEEPLWGFAASIIRPGEYITLTNPRSDEFVFRIVGVEAAKQ